MPTYDYECTKCRHRFEHRRSFSDNGTVKCPECKGKAQQIITSVPVIFKGKGFYVTDHRKPGDAADSGPANPASKPAVKPEAKKPGKIEAAK
jgi:putative FmdB family regulatory protein